MSVQYGNSAVSQRSVYEWVQTSKMVAEVLSVRKEPATEENGACMACLSAQNFLFQGQKADYVMM